MSGTRASVAGVIAVAVTTVQLSMAEDLSDDRSNVVANALAGKNAVRSHPPKLDDPNSVDLLRRIDITRDTVAGRWALAGSALYCKSKSGLAMIRLPYTPPDEYDLTILAERVSGCDQFTIGLTAGEAQFAVSLDRGGGRWSGLYGEIEVRGGLFRSFRESTIDIQVRKQGVAVTFDGEPVYEWKGDLKTVRMHPLFKETLDGERTMFLQLWTAQYIIHHMILTPK